MSLRRLWLRALPKALLSRATGALTHLPLPRPLRARVHGTFARRYGVDLGDVPAPLAEYPSLAAFFSRALGPGARPIAAAPLAWPCDGRIVTAGPLAGDQVPQVKGVDYPLRDLLQNEGLAAALVGGSQATIYLAPGDYHRVHVPFDGELVAVRRVPGSLYPVNPPAVRCVRGLFALNARVVFELQIDDGRAGAVVMVAALNVGDIAVTAPPPRILRRGDELGRFGFGSTVVALVAPGGPRFAAAPAEMRVRMGGDASALPP